MSDERIFRGTAEEIRKLKGETDWARLRAEEAAGIEPELDEDEAGMEPDWARAVRVPARKRSVTLRLDPRVLDFFKGEGRGYQTRINAVLRAYVEAQERKRAR